MQKRNTIVIGALKTVLFLTALVIAWEIVYRIGTEYLGIWKAYSFPSPLAVLKTLAFLTSDGTLPFALLASIRRIVTGYALSLIIGTAAGVSIIYLKQFGKILRSLILGFQTLPSICWLPFAVLWYGLDESAIIFIIAIGSTFAISVAVESSIRNVNPLYIKAARTMGAKGLRIYSDVIIPAAMPEILSGMKQGWSFAWRALMAGEMFAAATGLGQVLLMGRDLADINQVAAVMIVIIVLGLTVDKCVFGFIESGIRTRWGNNY